MKSKTLGQLWKLENIMKSLCQRVPKTIYLQDWCSRSHAGAKVTPQSYNWACALVA